MAFTARYADASGAVIAAEIDGASLLIPVDPRNRHYARLNAEGVVIEPYVPPPPPVPATVTRVQGRQALRNAGLFDQVVALINDPATSEEVRNRWDDLFVFERDSSFIADLAPRLDPPLSEADVDALFIAAAQID